MPMTCEHGVARLMDYLEGALAVPLRREVESHVAGCARCRAFVASYRAVPRIVRKATRRAGGAADRRALHEFLRARCR